MGMGVNNSKNINNRMKKNILIVGAGGGIGNELLNKISKEDYNIISPSSKELNISNHNDVNNFFDENKIDILINLAGKKYDFLLSDRNNQDEYKIGRASCRERV